MLAFTFQEEKEADTEENKINCFSNGIYGEQYPLLKGLATQIVLFYDHNASFMIWIGYPDFTFPISCLI